MPGPGGHRHEPMPPHHGWGHPRPYRRGWGCGGCLMPILAVIVLFVMILAFIF